MLDRNPVLKGMQTSKTSGLSYGIKNIPMQQMPRQDQNEKKRELMKLSKNQGVKVGTQSSESGQHHRSCEKLL